MKPWVVKHLPQSSSEVVAHKDSLESLRSFIQNTKQKAAVIYGPSGNGKTSAVYALANELSYEVLEVNASDFRNAEAINTIVGSASKQMSLFGKGKIILVDEIDGLSGMKDRGGVSALTKLIGDSSFPIICTAINPFDKKFSPLRKKSELIEFKTLILQFFTL
ncbi:AAA family ATPase [Nanoarchaeota archaeon]